MALLPPGVIIPWGQGIPAWRRTTGRHYFKYDSSKDHYVQSSAALEWTWRAHSGHFPIPESFPVVRLIWTRQKTLVSVPPDPDDETRLPSVEIIYILIPKLVTDDKPWRVTGQQYEDTGTGLVTNGSSATGCNWEHTFRSM